ncbi:uncharacterized protein YneF (UPF0154 family) [Cytobacillus kochii]|nr:uncharacterized protein YneF (UPF0154 family) [Cytobacillus kochii]
MNKLLIGILSIVVIIIIFLFIGILSFYNAVG